MGGQGGQAFSEQILTTEDRRRLHLKTTAICLCLKIMSNLLHPDLLQQFNYTFHFEGVFGQYFSHLKPQNMASNLFTEGKKLHPLLRYEKLGPISRKIAKRMRRYENPAI